ncbi:hypothetical protein RB195_014431 [Necator americanus]|uniref:Transthyretin-like family protein n=3 Tax=Necator americanus TaxID=51031 RepID=A0ABR1E017_NECAM
MALENEPFVLRSRRRQRSLPQSSSVGRDLCPINLTETDKIYTETGSPYHLCDYTAMRYIVVVALFGCTLAMRQQAVAVSGKLMCGNQPAAGVKVKLWDEDDGPDPDDVLDEGYTDSNGAFHLKGSERELTNIDPVFKVYHDCDDGIKPGQRKVKFRIPDSYISSGGVAKRVFDIGVLNLETIFPKEERDLL